MGNVICSHKQNNKYINQCEQKYDTDDNDQYEQILSSPGSLDIPDKIEKWFPKRHAHTDVRQLFTYHNALGAGSNGIVYEIEYKGKLCALKEYEKDNEWGYILFTTEARVLSKLKHDGIIEFIDVFLDETYYYLIIEKANYNLYSVIQSNGYLSENETKYLTYNLLKTLVYIHSKNLVHRDIKPDNIVFVDSGNIKNDNYNHLQPKLIDFGDAIISKTNKIYTEFVGTPSYMAPERLSKHKGSELKKSDIWAIATICYEMFTGNRCFDGITQKYIFNKITNSKWSWPKHRIPSNHLQDFIQKCLQINPNDRPSAIDAINHNWFDDLRKEEELKRNHLTIKSFGSLLSDNYLSMIDLNDLNNQNISKLKQLFWNKMDKRNVDIIYILKMVKNHKRNVLIYEQLLSTIKNQKEEMLFHGTSFKNINNIIHNGFNRDYNIRSLYGKGTYFTKHSSLAAKYSQQDYKTKYYSMFVCRVIIGNYTLGNKSMDSSMLYQLDNVTQYDSLVNNLNNPTTFVINRDYHAIPIYIIVFKYKHD